MNTESATIKEGVVTFDIKFRALLPASEEAVDMILNVEAQNNFYPGYPIVKRGIYYGSRMISEQYGTVFNKSEYDKIKKVASIWICTNPPDHRKNTIASYTIQENNIVGITNEKESNYDIITVVMVCLGGKGKDGYNGLLKMLDVLLSQDTEPAVKKKTLNEEFSIPMTKKLEGGLMTMCNLSQGVYDSGVDAATVDHVKNLMKNKGWSIEECMDVLEVPEEKRNVYKDIILGSAVSV